MIHVSTDYVFSGNHHRPYDELDEPYPTSVYGRTKLEGEGMLTSFCPDAVIIRTAWLYSEYGNNFVKTILKKGKEIGSLTVVCDQIGTPTYAGDLAEAITAILGGEPQVKVSPCATKDYPTPATRPSYSVLDKTKIKRTFGISIPYWKDSLRKCISRL